MPQTPSTRWCPTPEQLMILEEMYRSGVRTPNASEIQQITAHLSLYGKIEGKNVFYWFQNHKARDRQKLRRRLSQQHHHLLHGFNQLTHHPITTTPLHFHNMQLQEPPSPLFPTSQLNYHHFLHQGCSQVEGTTQGMNLLCKLDNGEGSSSSSSSSTISTACVCEWMVMMDYKPDVVHVPPPCFRPLRTLELFPTTSTGLKDEYSTSKSSSCSTSIN